MKKRILATVVVLMLANTQVFACDILGKTGFAPENNMRISIYDKDTNGMTEERFNQIIDRVEKAYAPVVSAKGAKLDVKKNWTDDTVNAFARRIGSNWEVQMFGGLARHAEVTDDGFMLVMCHETGHHLGGAPKKSKIGSTWASNEGQADYFGSLKCMRRVLENDDNVAIVAKMQVDASVVKSCELVYQNENDLALCKRIAMAGKSLALLLGQLGGSAKVSFDTPDVSVVKKTFDDHPKAQCRLDTYFQGSLCDKDWQQDVDDKDPTIGVCMKRDGVTLGVRPLCWYKPTKSEI